MAVVERKEIEIERMIERETLFSKGNTVRVDM